MNNPKISVIVPVYNVEKFLHRCVDSILAQTFADFEVLLIDDGCTDKSGEICDEYGKKDGRVRVFHQNNGGVSKARNVGLDYSKGEWVTFVDSDDWIEKEYLEKFSQKYDLSLLSYFYGDQPIEFENKEVLKNPGEDYLLNEYVYGPYCKLFRKIIIDKNFLRFDEKLSYGEDVLFWLQYICFCQTMQVSDYLGYHYELYESHTLSTSSKDYNCLIYMFTQHIKYFEIILKNSAHKNQILRKEIFNMFHDLISHYGIRYADIKENLFLKRCFMVYLNFMDRLVCYLVPSEINVYKRFLVRIHKL